MQAEANSFEEQWLVSSWLDGLGTIVRQQIVERLGQQAGCRRVCVVESGENPQGRLTWKGLGRESQGNGAREQEGLVRTSAKTDDQSWCRCGQQRTGQRSGTLGWNVSLCCC